MDILTPDFDFAEPASDEPDSPLSRIFIRSLLQSLSAALPANGGDSQDIVADRWEAAREMFFAMQPRNPIEAALAARAVAAHFATMDMYARAAAPGTSDEKALRLRGSAIAASRSFDTALRTLEKRQTKSREPAKAPVPPGPAATHEAVARQDATSLPLPLREGVAGRGEEEPTARYPATTFATSSGDWRTSTS
jgi:hypothetical protein